MQAQLLDISRDFYNVAWYDMPGADEVKGDTVTMTFESAGGDVSSTIVANGKGGPVSVMAGFRGTDKLTVKGSDGGELVVDEVEFAG